MTEATSAGDFLVSWSRSSASGDAYGEETAIGADGTLWMWVRVPLDSRRTDVIGTFRAAATADQVAEARRLAAAFADETAATTAVDPDAAGSVDVVAGGRSRRLAPGRETGVAREILALGDDLSAAAPTAPLSVARLGAAVNPSIDLSSVPGLDPSLLPPELAVPAGGGIIVRLVVGSDGIEPVAVVIDPAGLQVHWQAGDRTLEWAEIPRLEHGLMNGGGYVDGLRAPARLSPGASGGAIAGTLKPPPGADGLRLRATGLIQLIGPWQGLGTPADRFEAMSARIAL